MSKCGIKPWHELSLVCSSPSADCCKLTLLGMCHNVPAFQSSTNELSTVQRRAWPWLHACICGHPASLLESCTQSVNSHTTLIPTILLGGRGGHQPGASHDSEAQYRSSHDQCGVPHALLVSQMRHI